MEPLNIKVCAYAYTQKCQSRDLAVSALGTTKKLSLSWGKEKLSAL